MNDLSGRITGAIVGSGSDLSPLSPRRPARTNRAGPGFAVADGVASAFVCLLTAVLFAHPLQRIWWKANPFTGDPNWGHALFIPLIAAVYLYVNRSSLVGLSLAGHWVGAVVLFGSVGGFVTAAMLMKSDFLQGALLVVTLVGLVVLLGGMSLLRAVAFPVLLLACAIPWSDRIYGTVASPLQQLAATCAVHILRWSGVAVIQLGTNISLYRSNGTFHVLQVAEACSGLRSLMTFVALAAVVAFFSSRRLWVKLIITSAAVPIAVACNVLRVAGTGLLDHFVSERASAGFYHVFVGLTILIAGIMAILVLACVMDACVGPAGRGSTPSTDAPRANTRTSRWQWAVALVVLGVGCVTIFALPPVLHVRLAKVGLPAARRMSDLPAVVGDWQQVGEDQQLNADLTEALGADDYLLRDYALKPPAGTDPTGPPALIHLALTYYAQPLQAVPHTAERCYLASGYVVASTQRLSLSGSGRAGAKPPLTTRLIDFHDITGVFGGDRSVMYYFVANGHAADDPEAVAKVLCDPGAGHSYLFKAEVMNELRPVSVSAGLMSDFMQQLTPELDRLLPDWDSAERESP